jgi:hypothetical protein
MTNHSLQNDAAARRWHGLSAVRTGAELLLGISFITAMAFGGWGAVMSRTSVVAELAALTFCVSLVCVLVNWFRAVEDDGQ